jgi:hypothetical protein
MNTFIIDAAPGRRAASSRRWQKIKSEMGFMNFEMAYRSDAALLVRASCK